MNAEFKWLMRACRVNVMAPEAQFVLTHGVFVGTVGMPLFGTIHAIIVFEIGETPTVWHGCGRCD
jgi:hypothetical protein